MSTYAYRCKKCDHRFEKTMTLHEHEQAKRPPTCPTCGSRSVEQVPAAFQTMTSKKA